MDETLKALGRELRSRYKSILTLPLNWKLIDALTTIEERDAESSAAAKTVGDGSPARVPVGARADHNRRR